MLNTNTTIKVGEYSYLYDLLIPKDHMFRQWLALIDFSFVFDQLKDKYCHDNGRMAVDPVMMFKYLVLKAISNLSDVKLVERCRYDMSYKYFLGLLPEDGVIEASSLSRFRNQRLADTDIMDTLIKKTVEVAKEHKLIDGRTIIVDSTHTLSRCTPLGQTETLQKYAKALRKMIYEIDVNMKQSMPAKYEGDSLSDEINYVKSLVEFCSRKPELSLRENISEASSLLSEMVDDIEDHYTISGDDEARVGHKSADSEFYGYKTHIAMTPERLIVSASMTSGEKNDGPELPALIDKAIEVLPELERVVGDGAYSGQKNLEKAEDEGIKIVSKLNSRLLEGSKYEEKGFSYNKDAEMLVCPAGHMSISKKQVKDRTGNDRITYLFSRKHCGVCALRDTCLGQTKEKRQKVSAAVKTKQQIAQIEFMDTEEFKRWSKERYKIEAKNSELKNNYGYDRAIYYGVCGMRLQGAAAIFASNLCRIVRLMSEKQAK